MKIRYAAVSGGLDPITFAHTRMISEAAKYGRVIVILNSDEWLLRKKGYVFMPFKERKEILMALENVSYVVKAKDDDDTVCQNLREIRPDAFCNGGDRKSDSTPEVQVCEELGIEMIWEVGGREKIQSSSWLVQAAIQQLQK